MEVVGMLSWGHKCLWTLVLGLIPGCFSGICWGWNVQDGFFTCMDWRCLGHLRVGWVSSVQPLHLLTIARQSQSSQAFTCRLAFPRANVPRGSVMEPSRVPMTQPCKLSNMTSFSFCQSKLSHRAKPWDSRRQRGGSNALIPRDTPIGRPPLETSCHNSALSYFPFPETLLGRYQILWMFLRFLFIFYIFNVFVLLSEDFNLAFQSYFFSKISSSWSSHLIAFFPCVVHMNSCLLSETTTCSVFGSFHWFLSCLFLSVPLVDLDVSCLCWGLLKSLAILSCTLVIKVRYWKWVRNPVYLGWHATWGLPCRVITGSKLPFPLGELRYFLRDGSVSHGGGSWWGHVVGEEVKGWGRGSKDFVFLPSDISPGRSIPHPPSSL